jgi:hypothetical protein
VTDDDFDDDDDADDEFSGQRNLSTQHSVQNITSALQDGSGSCRSM